MNSLETILDEHGDQVAAFIFEPMVQGAAGMRVYPSKVLTRAFEICRKHGVLTIDDEVAMGFGRTGKRFACEHAGVTPDIMCLAKGLTAGYLPLSATVVSSEIYDEFKGKHPGDRIFHHGHSFTGNPLAASAAVAALTLFKRDDIPDCLSDLMEQFRTCLKATFEDCPIVGDIRSIGMVGALELVRDRTTKERLPEKSRIAERVCRKATERGILLRPLGDVIYFIPAFIITEEQIDHMFGITRECLNEVLDEESTNL
jgi:adenosylmethionine-8-amino-7-oxononanoate aminotransferase